MKWLTNLKISTNLPGAFILMILLCVAVGITGYFDMNIVSAAICLTTIILGVFMAIGCVQNITGPLNRITDMMKELGVGNFQSRLKMGRKDEIGILAGTMDQFADDFQNIVIGTMKKISDGDLSTDIVLKDDKDEIAPALKGTIDSLRNLTAGMNKMYQEQKAGEFDYFMKTDGFKGVYKEVADGYNATVKIPIDAILQILGILTSYAEGDFSPVLERLTGKQIVANEKMDLLRNNLLSLISETEMLTKGAAEGKLVVRGDITKFKGDYIKIIKGINDTLNNIVVPLNESLIVLAKEAENDLTKHVTGEYQGDLNKLKDAINASTDTRIDVVLKLKRLTQDLMESGKQLTTASEQAGQATQQIASSSQQVAKGAADQAMALQDTLKAVEGVGNAIDQIAKGAQEQAKMMEQNVQMVGQVSTAITQVSANAQNASAGAKVAAESAQKGAAMSRETVKGMENVKKTMDVVSSKIHGLGERSKEIGKIVSAIDDIADQTNLLALNAAVEAARAGEQGRGFAVVADEVRKLAERSQAATKEIADLISGIQSGVEDTVVAMEKGTKEIDGGYDLANQAGQSLDDILARSRDVGIQVEQISSAAQQLTAMSTEMVKLSDSISAIVEENTATTEEMAATAKGVTQSIESVAGVAEENSAATEQVSAAAEEISAQMQQVVASGTALSMMATDFEKMVALYKLNGNGHSKEHTEALASAIKNS
jgi:methyl-accepting chemotaxis protein